MKPEFNGTGLGSYTYSLLWRLIAIISLGAAAVFALWATLAQHATWATIILLLLLMGVLFSDVMRLISRTNTEMTRLVTALQFADFTQSFESNMADANFPELGQALEQLISRLREEMAAVKSESSHFKSLIDQVPIPLLCIDNSERVMLLNNTARRLFNRPHGMQLNAFSIYGQHFADQLRSQEMSRIVCINPPDDAAQQMRMTQTHVTMQNQSQRLIALQPIQSDIDAAELALSNDLVRVLTHEIMNSLTPITSLAKTASALSEHLPANPENQALRGAVDTVARRADGLMQFVNRYREATGTTILNLEQVHLKDLLQEIETLFRAEYDNSAVALQIAASPTDIVINADKQLLMHVLINLLRNAAQASIGHTSTPIVCIRIRETTSGRALIEIDDNGTGIDEALRTDIFLPFFTTKPSGSGVGLSLARKIILAHGGSLSVEPSQLGGACLRTII